MAGFGRDRPATGVNDPLLARAVVLRHGKQKLAIVSVDLAARRIDVDRDFLALDDEHESEEPVGPADGAEAGGDGGETADRGARP